MSFIGELKRRKVFRVAAAYAVVGWLVVQIVATVAEPLSLPGWTATVVIVLVLVGFPLALVLSWGYDITARGVVRTPALDDSPVGQATAVSPGALARAALAGAHSRAVVPSAPTAVDVLPNSVAVLPFQNLSAEQENAYFAAGIHESILNKLAQVRDMSVIARTSVLRYADGHKTVPEIGAELNVQTVMEGSVRYAGKRVRITAQLIDARTGAHLWSEEYDRDLADIFEIQSDIATRIAAALEAKLLPLERKRLEAPPTSSPEAFALYLKGVAIRLKGPIVDEGQIAEAIGYLDRALGFDADFGAAYALKGRLYAEALISGVAPAGGWPKRRAELAKLALENIARALSCDPNLGLAHVASAQLDLVSWHAAEARRSYQRAIDASPNDPLVLMDAAWFHMFLDEHDAALRLAERAVQLDPNGVDTHARLAHVYSYAGKEREALAAAERAIASDPSSWLAHHVSAEIPSTFGRRTGVVEHLRRAEQLAGAISPSYFIGWWYLGKLAGAIEETDHYARRVAEIARNQHVGLAGRAMAHLARNERDAALRCLREAANELVADEGWYHLQWLARNHYSDPVLERPEFAAVRSRLRLTS